jgi:hypothetical protein
MNNSPVAGPVENERGASGAPQAGRVLLRMLSGPIVYAVYFLAVYLLVEATCQTGWIQFSLGGTNGLTLAVIGLTAVAAVVVLLSLLAQVRRLRMLPAASDPELGDPERFAARVGMMLDLLSLLLVLATGAPALVLAPCAWMP